MPLFQKANMGPTFSLEGELENVACFFYMMKGTMASFDSRGRHITTTKNAILKNCGKYVQRFDSGDAKEDCVAIAVFLYPELLQEIFKNEVPSFLKVNYTVTPKKVISNRLVEQYMTNLSIYFEDPEAFDEELGIIKLKELMLILLKTEEHSNIRQLISEIFTPTYVELKTTIENNLYNHLNMEQLAFLCNMSLSKFKREFKKVYNSTPASYIKKRRLSEAQRKLVSTTDSITEIAFSVGFEDLSTFSSNFKSEYGVTPSQFKKGLNH